MVCRLIVRRPSEQPDDQEKGFVGNTILLTQPRPEEIIQKLPPPALSDWNEVSRGCIIVGLFRLSIESATFLLPVRKRFWSQCNSKLGAREHGRIVLQSTGSLQHCLPRLMAPSAELIFSVLCSSCLREQVFESRSSRSRHGNDFLVTMCEATPLSFQRLQC